VKTDAQVLDVHLGPSWYLKKQGFVFAVGDKL
jgi:hypothetical protein